MCIYIYMNIWLCGLQTDRERKRETITQKEIKGEREIEKDSKGAREYSCRSAAKNGLSAALSASYMVCTESWTNDAKRVSLASAGGHRRRTTTHRARPCLPSLRTSDVIEACKTV